MKFNANIKIGKVEGKVSGKEVKVENVELGGSVELTCNEFVTIVGTAREVIADLPDIVEDLAKTVVTFMHCDKHINELEEKQEAEKKKEEPFSGFHVQKISTDSPIGQMLVNAILDKMNVEKK